MFLNIIFTYEMCGLFRVPVTKTSDILAENLTMETNSCRQDKSVSFFLRLLFRYSKVR